MELFDNEFHLKYIAHKMALNKINELLNINHLEPHLKEKVENLHKEFH